MKQQNDYLLAGQYFGSAVRQIVTEGLTLTLSRYSDDEAQPWHTHENPTLFLLLQGGLRDRRRKAETDVETLMLVYHPVDELHCSETGPQGMFGLNIEPSLAWLSAYQLAPADLGPYAALPCPTARLSALRLLLQAFTQPGMPDYDLENDTFDILTSLAAQHLSRSEARPPRWLRRVESYLHDSLAESISLRDAAREADVHPVHLARVFRAYYGCSVGEYLRRQRLLRAANCSLQHQTPLCTAAYEAGFADQAHFTRLFTREFGVRPKALLRLRASV